MFVLLEGSQLTFREFGRFRGSPGGYLHSSLGKARGDRREDGGGARWTPEVPGGTPKVHQGAPGGPQRTPGVPRGTHGVPQRTRGGTRGDPLGTPGEPLGPPGIPRDTPGIPGGPLAIPMWDPPHFYSRRSLNS